MSELAKHMRRESFDDDEHSSFIDVQIAKNHVTKDDITLIDSSSSAPYEIQIGEVGSGATVN
jgi:hypothetical protein